MLGLPKIKARREERLTAGIDARHAAMAQDSGPVGELARLYDRLQVASAHSSAIEASGAIAIDRKRAMYIGGVAFFGNTAAGECVKVDIRRNTTYYPKGSGHAELSIFLTGEESRIRARLYTGHRDGSWQSEGTMGLPSDVSRHYMSRRAPELTSPQAVGQLVGDVALLAAEVLPRELPPAPHVIEG